MAIFTAETINITNSHVENYYLHYQTLNDYRNTKAVTTLKNNNERQENVACEPSQCITD